MRVEDEMGTYYVPDGETRTVEFVEFRRSNESNRTLWTDDNGTLLAVVTVEEAEAETALLLKQHGAARLIRRLIVLEETDAWDPSDQKVKIARTEAGNYNVEVK